MESSQRRRYRELLAQKDVDAVFARAVAAGATEAGLASLRSAVVLADRALSRLLHKTFPRTLDE